MSRSTRLATTVHILVYLAYHDGTRVRIDDLAKSVNANPSRLRQLCRLLSHSGFVRTFKGARGGIKAIFLPHEVSLYDLCLCLEDDTFFALSSHDANKKCPIGGAVSPVIRDLYKGYNNTFREYLRTTTIRDLMDNMEQAGIRRSEAEGEEKAALLKKDPMSLFQASA